MQLQQSLHGPLYVFHVFSFTFKNFSDSVSLISTGIGLQTCVNV